MHRFSGTYIRASCIESGFTMQLGTGGDTERLHACMGSPVCDEEAEVDRITSNVMCLARPSTTAKCETLAEPCCLKIGGR